MTGLHVDIRASFDDSVFQIGSHVLIRTNTQSKKSQSQTQQFVGIMQTDGDKIMNF